MNYSPLIALASLPYVLAFAPLFKLCIGVGIVMLVERKF